MEGFRALFGDERLDYGDALNRHYQQGAPADWQNAFVSSYATMHPWEDWAETWAHYMHIVDTLEMAGLSASRLRRGFPAIRGWGWTSPSIRISRSAWMC
jgi:hypothetical protein